jgi:hypothetical protein
MERQLVLTPIIYDFIQARINEFNKTTQYEYEMDFEEVLFSFLNSTDDTHFVLNDWDEGESNDPYWNKERNKHCCECFLEDINKELQNIYK